MTTKIGVILGTPRRNSLGAKLLNYLQGTHPDTADVTYTWMPLRDYPLPFYDHQETPLATPIHDLDTAEKRWLDCLAAQDGYIILSPEYDHAIPGILKNALDFVGGEVDHKPVQIVTYSQYSDGGVLAAESMVEILQMLKMLVLPTPVLLWNATQNFTTDGTLIPTAPNSAHFAQRLQAVFDEVTYYSHLLQVHPYHPAQS